MFCNRGKGSRCGVQGSGFRVVVTASPQVYMKRCPKVCGWQVSLVSPAFPAWGRQRGGDFAAQKGSQPRLTVLGSPFQGKGLAWTLPPSYGRRCPEGAEVGWGKRDEKERERSSQVRRLREHPGAAVRSPLPQGGRLRYENTAFLALSERIHVYVEKE